MVLGIAVLLELQFTQIQRRLAEPLAMEPFDAHGELLWFP